MLAGLHSLAMIGAYPDVFGPSRTQNSRTEPLGCRKAVWQGRSPLKVTASAEPPFRLEPLASYHPVAAFTSGDAAIDPFLRASALAEQTMGLSSVTVAIDPHGATAIVGFFTLSPLSIRIDPRVLAALGLGSVPYPSVGGYLLGRLGVDRSYQRRGIGQAFVAVAIAQARNGREDTGGVFIAVDAKDDSLVRWYERLGFSRFGQQTHRCVMRL